MAIPITLEQFEGPLDLLLQLVRRSEISVWEIRIQQICEQFVAYTRQLEAIDVEVAGDFMVLAATLMRIKARLLLPRPEPEEENEAEEMDEEEQLLARLLLYEGYREAAEQLELMAEQAAVQYTRGQTGEDLPADESDPLAGVTLLTLAVLVQKALQELPAPQLTVTSERYSLSGQMAHIRRCIAGSRQLSFFQLLSGQPNREEIVTTFLAILELVRIQEIRVWQRQGTDDVLIAGREPNA
jgi:segregation and condensation protein A